MKHAPRPYQRQAFLSVRRMLREHQSTLLVLATGLGKTVVFSLVAESCVAEGGRVLILAHRDELLAQAKEKLLDWTDFGPLEIGLEQQRHRALDSQPIVIASKDSMHARRLKGFPRDAFRLVITDEAHRSPAPTYRRIYEHFANAKHLGVTATPMRLDQQSLGQIFASVAMRYEILDAVDDGWLVKPRRRLCQIVGLDLSGVHKRTSRESGERDFNEAELAQALETSANVAAMAKAIIENVGERPTLIFAVRAHRYETGDRRGHLYQLASALNELRPGCAAGLDGTCDDRERRDTQRRFRAHELQFLVNCQLFTEGWDEPSVSAVVMARPTTSPGFYLQMLGRGTRLLGQSIAESVANGKPDLLVLDFEGNSSRHDLVGLDDVLGGDAEAAHKARRKRRERDDGEQGDPEGMTREEEQLVMQEAVQGRVTHRSFEILSQVELLRLRLPRHNGERANAKLMMALQIEGFQAYKRLSQEQALAVLRAINERHRAGLCSLRQASILARCGVNPNVTKQTASRIIGRLEKNGWKPTSQMLVDVELMTLPEEMGARIAEA